MTGQEPLAVRASKKLKNDELLVVQFAPTRLRLELDRIPLWRAAEAGEANHVSIRQLAEDFARYIYLPRLQKPSVLVDAVREGIALLSWSKDAFAYAESYDEESRRYRGLRFAQQVAISEDGVFGLLVKPETALKQHQAEKSVIEGPATTEREISGGRLEMAGEVGATVETAAQPSQPKRFHGSVKLDPTRVGRDAGRVADEVIAHLVGLVGSNVTVTLEIEADIASGTPENVVRTVTENCRTLKFSTHGFEKE
jgi:hypothetical protein